MQKVIKTSSLLDSINSIIEKDNYKRVFFFTGSIGYNFLKENNFHKDSKYYIHSDFSNDPNIEDVYDAAKLISDFNPDLVVAIGGGSVIDTAKQVNYLFSNYNIHSTTKNLLSEYIINKNLSFDKKSSPLVIVPTTAGTGSEATQFAVVYINKIKYSIDNEKLLPEYVILYPKLLQGMKPELIATTTLDALSQSIESLWSINSNDTSTKYASIALKLIKKNIELIANGYTNTDIIKDLMEAAHLSGKAINITRTTAPHAISYPLTMHLNIPHGHAVALTLPIFFIINSSIEKYTINNSIGKEYLKSRMEYIFELFLYKGATAKDCQKEFSNLMDILNLETKLSKLGLKKINIKSILNDINKDRLANNPILVSSKDINEILTAIF